MSTRTTLRPQAVISAGNMSGNLTSAVTILQSQTLYSYEYTWSGTSPVGTIIVQLSNSYSLDGNGNAVVNPGSWTTIPFISSTGSVVSSFSVSGNTGTGLLDITTAAYATRTIYTAGSGTGTLTAIVCGKVA